ncbi:hypothetical protein Acr_05g0003800 [Actinidia rufa]|uniref:AAR2 C-terminal domain-containing protein n=1 Tax=Actinidia rufa TaxID=165716 RepID=A0A7J0EJU8_9ERIC|nr:hypothetical protein Acr_05g0003800 [Actinidia rufa]
MVGNIPKTSMEKAFAEQVRNSNFSRSVDKSQRSGCYYTPIPRVIKQKGIHGQELTCLNLDKTKLLESILMKDYGGCEDLILVELQFAFVAFLMGQSLEAFFQWKSLVSPLSGMHRSYVYSCVSVCHSIDWHIWYPGTNQANRMRISFIKVIYYQLKYGFQKERTDTGGAEKCALTLLDESWLSSDSFLHHLCKTRKFKELLEDTLGWDFQPKSAVDGTYYEEDDEKATNLVSRGSGSFTMSAFNHSDVSYHGTYCLPYFLQIIVHHAQREEENTSSGSCCEVIPFLRGSLVHEASALWGLAKVRDTQPYLSSRSYASRRPSDYDLFGNGKPGDEEFRKAWRKEMDEESSLWTGSEDESDGEQDRNSLEEEIRRVKQQAKDHSDLIDGDDSDELRSVWSGSDEEKTLWTGDEGDDDDDIPTEPYPNEKSDAYIDKLFEFEEKPKYRTISELLKAEKEPEELSPGSKLENLRLRML